MSPHIEKWASQSRLLRRWRLSSPDEPREILLLAIERLMRSDYANLRAFLATPAAAPARDPSETERAADAIAELSQLLDVSDASAEPVADDTKHTPFRAWLRRLVEFSTRDHLYARLGRADGELAARGGTKRDLHSEAKPFTPSDLGGQRPPMTDVLTIRKIAETVAAYAAERLTPAQWQAVQMRRDDASFDEIASALQLDSPEAARKLVRAGIERLRSHFNDQWSLLGGT